MYTLNATGVHGVAQPVYEMHGQDSRVRELSDVCTTVSATYGSGGGNVPVTIQPIAFSGQMSNPQTDVDMTQTLQAKNPIAVCLGGQHPNAGIGIDQSNSRRSKIQSLGQQHGSAGNALDR